MAGFARITLHQDEIDRLMRSEDGAVVQKIDRYTRRTETAAKRRAPVDNGKLRASITSQTDIQGKRIVGTIWTPVFYAIYQHEGTGVYAGNGPIKPKNGKFLVFKPKQGHPQGKGRKGGKGGLVFARQVKGVPPNPFLEDALKSVVPWKVRETG